MGAYLLRRLLTYLVLLFVAVSLTYLLAATQLHPRQIFQLASPPLDPQAVEQTLRSRNLSDRVPLLERYATWLRNVTLHWDWGEGPMGGSVRDEIGRRAGVSLRLIGLGAVVGSLTGIALGAWSAARHDRLGDRATAFGSLVILSVPAFVVAGVLETLAIRANRLLGAPVFEFVGETGARGSYPGAGLVDRAQHLLLPTLTLVLLNAAFFSRIQRNVTLDALGADFVRTARAKGLRHGQAVIRHALRSSLIPAGSYLAFTVATLFTGATFMELLFSFHGMGEYAVASIIQQDVHATVAVAAFAGACVLVGAMLADIAAAALDPRVRLAA